MSRFRKISRLAVVSSVAVVAAAVDAVAKVVVPAAGVVVVVLAVCVVGVCGLFFSLSISPKPDSASTAVLFFLLPKEEMQAAPAPHSLDGGGEIELQRERERQTFYRP